MGWRKPQIVSSPRRTLWLKVTREMGERLFNSRVDGNRNFRVFLLSGALWNLFGISSHEEAVFQYHIPQIQFLVSLSSSCGSECKSCKQDRPSDFASFVSFGRCAYPQAAKRLSFMSSRFVLNTQRLLSNYTAPVGRSTAKVRMSDFWSKDQASEKESQV